MLGPFIISQWSALFIWLGCHAVSFSEVPSLGLICVCGVRDVCTHEELCVCK